MPTELAVKEPATTFRFKMEIGIKDSNSGHVVVAPQKFECDIEVPSGYATHATRKVRSENIALQRYATQLESDMETNALLRRRLKGIDWVLFHKVITVKEL